MNPIGIQLRISDILYALQKRWKIIFSLTFMGLVFGLLLSGMNYVQSAVNTYQIRGSFIIAAVNSQGRYPSNSTTPNWNDISMSTDLYDSVNYLLRSDRLMYQIIDDEQLLGVAASDIRDRLYISQYNDTNIITMQLTWDSSEEGLMMWDSIINAANKLLFETFQVGQLRVFNEAEAVPISSRSANLKTWMLLPILGFGAGIGFSMIELLMHPSLINVKDVETVLGLETLGIIPHDSEFFANKTSLLMAEQKDNSSVIQSFSAAAYILRNRVGSKARCHCFYITSTDRQEGRSSVAANLAIQLSDMERRTLLIDFDYKNPMLGPMFMNNIDYSRSLNALYRGEISIRDAITPMTGYLDLLPMVMEQNFIYLDSTIVDIITQMKEGYEYVIIDAPPVGKESEALRLNQVANSVLFVIRYASSTIPDIQNALEKLNKSGTRILGCIVNDMQSTRNVILGTEKKEAEKKRKTEERKKKNKKKKASGAKKEEEKQEIKENEDAVLKLTGQEKKLAPDPVLNATNPAGGTADEEGKTQEELPAQAEGTALKVAEEQPAPPVPEKKKRGLFDTIAKIIQEPARKQAKQGKKAKTKAKPEKTKTTGGKPMAPESAENKKTDIFDMAAEGAVVNKPRNVFEDIMDDEPVENAGNNDEEITEALLRIGLDGTWDQPEGEDEESSAKSGKKDPFDDL